MSTVRKGETARPLTARSIIASTLLGTHPPLLPVAVVVRSCALFGVSENAARVALSRMVTAGEVTFADGRYELVGRLRERQARQDRSRVGLTSDAWDGTWLVAVIPGEARPASDRSDLRARLRQRRYGEWREGVWIRPDNLGDGTEDRRVLTPCMIVERAVIPDERNTASQVFRLVEWAARAIELRAQVRGQATLLRRGDASILPNAFVTNAAVLRHFQSDPFLPPPLLPKRWPGPALRLDFETFDALFQTVWRRALRD